MKRRPKPPVPEENLAADAAAILQIKVWLTGISPTVWRRVLVPATFTFRELHGVIHATSAALRPAASMLRILARCAGANFGRRPP